MSKEKEDCPKMVTDDVCKARMDTLDSKMKYLFGTSIITIALIIVQLVRG
jgi:hypothetical protein